MSDVRLVPVSREQREMAQMIVNVATSNDVKLLDALCDSYDAALPADELRERIAFAIADSWLVTKPNDTDYRCADAVLRVLGIDTP